MHFRSTSRSSKSISNGLRTEDSAVVFILVDLNTVMQVL